MNCLTDEQLATLALGIAEVDRPASAHVEQCDACHARLSEMRRITDQLMAAHSGFNHNHAASRAQLLAKLSTTEQPASRVASWKWLARQLDRLTIRQRVAAGGVGLTTVIGLMLLILVMSSAGRLSAMERMVKQLREVTSFSFELEETSDRISGDNRRRIQRNDTNFWRAPASWHGTTTMVRLPLPPAPSDVGELLTDVEEIYPPGERGILIDHKKKTFFRTRLMKPDDFPDYSPVNWVQRMSKGNVKVTADLGTKQLHGKTAHGYIVSLGHPNPDSGANAVQLWVDTETDLPMEFRYEDKDDLWTNVMRIHNCRWNIVLDDAVFEMIEPVGYDDNSWPTETKPIEQIVDALRLYAELSSGHFPRVNKFDGDEIHDEMRRLAGASPPPQDDAGRDTLLQKVEQAKVGLDWATRILRNEHHSGYYGTEVGPNDKQMLLMWWPDHIGDYRVIYGDLRSEELSFAEWSKLVPPEVAESHAPVEYSKPGR
jgi:hypothetical protein